MAHPSLGGLWPEPDDTGHDDDFEPIPAMSPSEREIALRRMERDPNPLVRQMAEHLRKLDPAPGPVCRHGVDMTAAGCGRCLFEDEQMGAFLAQRFGGQR